jgi:O-antigen/teichoic acid export membrane protein
MPNPETVANPGSLIRKAVASPMIRGSAVLWVGMMAANLSNYLFHLLMGRFLGPVNYGVLASIISVLYYLMVPTTTITTTVMKFAAEFDTEGSPGKIHTLFVRMTKQILLISVALFLIMAAASPFICRFLNIKSAWPMLILSVMLLVAYVLPINRGIMQGLQKFGTLSINLILETVIKLAVGIALVVSGWAVNGAVFGIVLAVFFAYAVSFLPLRKILEVRDSASVSLRAIWGYSIPVFIVLLCINSYYSVDIILAKHFLPAVAAGHYSGLSILGKIVFFASMAIVGVMFPLVASRHKAEQKHSHLLAYTLGLITLVSGAIVAVYALAPELIIRLLFGTKYLAVAPYLGIFGAAMLMIALATAIANYCLAVNKTSCVYILGSVAFIQIGLLWVFHGSLAQLVNVMVGISAVLLAALTVYYFAAVRGASEPEPDSSPPVPLPTEF